MILRAYPISGRRIVWECDEESANADERIRCAFLQDIFDDVDISDNAFYNGMEYTSDSITFSGYPDMTISEDDLFFVSFMPCYIDDFSGMDCAEVAHAMDFRSFKD